MERLMQYVWQHRLWPQSHLRTVGGQPVRIIDPGRLNTDAGPDFFNAKVVIDGHTWVGDIEIHVRASDWHRHGHQNDPAYNSVILHVVDRDDMPIVRSDGQTIPQMRMACTPDFYQKYASLVDSADRSLPCSEYLTRLPALHLNNWLDALLYERLYDKTDRINRWLRLTDSDWDAAAYISLARCLGFSVNGDPFERLALATPLIFIAKHCDSILTIEALLFGQSGLLDSAPDADPYVVDLRREYAFMAHKFNLRRPESLGWKMSRMRPPNFPHRRIATLAALLHRSTRLTAAMLEVRSLDQAARMFDVELSDYWHSHYFFGPGAATTPSGLSRSSVISLAINAIAPMQFAYGMARDNSLLTDSAIQLLQSLPAERNSIVGIFQRVGIKTPDAATSQSLIQLRRAYCETRKCLYCRIGHRLLASRSPRRD